MSTEKVYPNNHIIRGVRSKQVTCGYTVWCYNAVSCFQWRPWTIMAIHGPPPF